MTDKKEEQAVAKKKAPETRAYSHLVYRVTHMLTGESKIYRGIDAKHIHDKTIAG